jgi:hypothetical protein
MQGRQCFAAKATLAIYAAVRRRASADARVGRDSGRTGSREPCAAGGKCGGPRGGGGGVPRGAVHGPGVTGPSRHACTAVQRRWRVEALWSTERGGARDVARSGITCCGTCYFDHDLLQKIELKCT